MGEHMYLEVYSQSHSFAATSPFGCFALASCDDSPDAVPPEADPLAGRFPFADFFMVLRDVVAPQSGSSFLR